MQVAPWSFEVRRSELGTELSQTLRGQQTSHRSGEPFERLSGIHASIHV